MNVLRDEDDFYALAMDYVDFGIRFNSVCYGYIVSGLHDVKSGFPVEEMLTEDFDSSFPEKMRI